jgi:hypothetical protein
LQNNILHSLITEMKMIVNNEQGTLKKIGFRYYSLTSVFISVSPYTDYYNYKAYLQDFLDYSEETKKTQLAPQGWASDFVGRFDSINNTGWMQRRKLFLKYTRNTNPVKVDPPVAFEEQFRDDTVTIVGRLRNPLEHCKQGLLPNSHLIIQLFFSNPDFAVWSPAGVEDHMLKIEKCTLYVPVAMLNAEINNRLEHELNQRAALYHFRELRCQVHPINAQVMTFESPELRAPTQAAIKIYVAFVKRSAFEGSQHENP